MSTKATDKVQFGQVTVELSNLDRVLFPDEGITKGDLVEHYRLFADRIVAQIANRPLTLDRWPRGLSDKGFIQQEAPGYFPGWVARATVPRKEGGEIEHVSCDNAETLLYLVNQGVITLHAWLAKADRPTFPDQLIFDLDPSHDDFDEVRQAALDLHELLDEVGLPSYLKTTGGRGLHVTVPLARRHEVDMVLSFARDVAATLVDRAPDRLTAQIRKDKRQGRLYIDTARNGYGQTAVAPFMVRARPGALVATPLSWEELDDPALRPNMFTIDAVRQRRGNDPWQGMADHAASLTKAQRRIDTVKPESGR
ncbi:MAG: ATP-dependent DNA ligase [Longispora sp.]|nr:ATP-dependent DNA ligase [Longispora sp. (in: high G+C Gram-positive bacteria)]